MNLLAKVISIVLAFGLVLTLLLGTRVFDLEFDATSAPFWLILSLILIVIPAGLAAMPPKIAMWLLAVVSLGMGLWSWSVLQTPGDGAIGGVLVAIVLAALLAIALPAIGLRWFLIKKQ